MLFRRQVARDDGAGTLLTLASIAVVLSLTVGLLTMMSIMDQWNQAKRVADQAALAASIDILRDTSHSCIAASELVISNGYLLDSCLIFEDQAIVRVGFIPRSKMAQLALKRIQVFSVATMQSAV